MDCGYVKCLNVDKILIGLYKLDVTSESLLAQNIEVPLRKWQLVVTVPNYSAVFSFRLVIVYSNTIVHLSASFSSSVMLQKAIQFQKS